MGPANLNNASITSNRGSTAFSIPDDRLSQIPKPAGSAGRKASDTRQGYSLLDESCFKDCGERIILEGMRKKAECEDRVSMIDTSLGPSSR